MLINRSADLTIVCAWAKPQTPSVKTTVRAHEEALSGRCRTRRFARVDSGGVVALKIEATAKRGIFIMDWMGGWQAMDIVGGILYPK
jgi:hypothetical protein